ncbi:Vacuolar inheritance and morphology protein [Emydomyces testavorans]|uniref:Vacuolar inheritance and morphology protein n=1 Tax=Emydomyces testavorans TaxID=2070801 RepID=A0AAF0DGP1_9EURO|nr:Vacuolar inheritance and morphology protein [Emydomyces testavorans]
MSLKNDDNTQRSPDWEIPSVITTSCKNGNHGHGLRPSEALVLPSTRDAQSNGTTQPSKHLTSGRSVPLSSTSSVVSSRETSPTRTSPRTANSMSTLRPVPRSRRNSQDLGPSRTSSVTSIGRTSIPIVLDLQGNAVDANNLHIPPPSSDASADCSEPIKSNMPTKPGDPPLQWAKLNRMKSPPPNLPSRTPLQRTTSPKRTERDAVSANSSSKRYHVESDIVLSPDKYVETSEDPQTRNPSRGLGRGGAAPALETVQEGSVPRLTTIDLSTSGSPEGVAKTVKAAGDSGSDSGSGKGADSKTDSNHRCASANPKVDESVPKRSLTSLSSARGKVGETSMTNMTVETETVSSVPQVSLGGGAGERGGLGRKDAGAALRLRPSDETIRPKKEKKRTRKPTLPPGTASSKADIFEAKVASAVDDADSSDSAETFVYESNPPDPHPSRQHRYHSRTPSAASMVGQLDQYGNRLRPGVRDALHGIIGKRSMKFTNTSYNTMDGEGEDRSVGRGSSRGNGHMHTARHYHIGRPGGNGVHQSLLDQSPFQSSQSPKSPRQFFGNGHSRNLKKDGDTYGYDFDAEGADDERTPLVGVIRGTRGRRRPNSASLRQMEYLERRRNGFCARYAICTLLLLLFTIVTSGSIIFIIGATQPLKNVHVREIQNVLASEQTIMLDLDIAAINANIFALTINDMDVNIFAKSRYVGSDAFWRDRGPHPKELPRTTDSRKRAVMARALEHNSRERDLDDSLSDAIANATGGIDRGTDPIPDDDLSADPQTMLLGRIFHFASPLIFEPSPWKQVVSNSTGQVRLTKPGNRTEEGGSLRWERVLQHPFELIVRGVIKYQLPLTSGSRSASISSKINVRPGEDGNGDKDDDHDDNGDHDDRIPGDSVHIR